MFWKRFTHKHRPLSQEEVVARFYRAITLYGVMFGAKRLAAVLGTAAIELSEADGDLTLLLDMAREAQYQLH